MLGTLLVPVDINSIIVPFYALSKKVWQLSSYDLHGKVESNPLKKVIVEKPDGNDIKAFIKAEYDFTGITGEISDIQLYDLCRKPAAAYSIRSCLSLCKKAGFKTFMNPTPELTGITVISTFTRETIEKGLMDQATCAQAEIETDNVAKFQILFPHPVCMKARLRILI